MSETLSQQALQALDAATADEKEHIIREALEALRSDKMEGTLALTLWCRMEATDAVAGKIVKASKRALLKANKDKPVDRT